MDSSVVVWVIWSAIVVISAIVIWIGYYVHAREMDKFISEEMCMRKIEHSHDKVTLLSIEVTELKDRVTALENQINIVKQ